MGSLLLVTEHLSDLGGTESLACRLAIAMRLLGWEASVRPVFRPRHDRWARVLASEGIPVQPLVGAVSEPGAWDQRAWRRRVVPQALAAARLLQLARSRPPPVVAFVPTAGAALLAMRLGLHRLAPCVGLVLVEPSPATAHWFPADLPTVINRLAGVIALTERIRAGIRTHLGYRGPVLVAPQPAAEAAAAGTPEDPRSLGCIARLSVEKGTDFAVAAVRVLQDEGRDCRLTVYGDGPDSRRLAEFAAAIDVSHRVRLAGTFEPGELDSVVARHAMFVQPSLYEGLPLATLDVLARGRPVVGTRVSGLDTLLPDRWLVPPGRPESLARVVAGVLEELEHAPEAVAQEALDRFGAARGNPPAERRIDAFLGECARSWPSTRYQSAE